MKCSIQQQSYQKKRGSYPLIRSSQKARKLSQHYDLNSNHVHNRMLRQSSYERQADAVATQILSGKSISARHCLTPAPAATFKLPGSHGEPLPLPLRTKLEAGFDAKLASIRIHRDVTAHAAAQKLKAEAFAAGSDIYFARQTYQPETPQGLHLLLHEVAHSLQQTGRQTKCGQFQTTPAAGTGAVQLTPRESPLTSTSPSLSIHDIATRYFATEAGVSDANFLQFLNNFLSTLQQAQLTNTEETFWNTLEQQVLSGAFDPTEDENPQILRSFLYDALKSAGRWTPALYLLGQDTSLPTTFFDAELYESIPLEVGFGFLDTVWTNHEFFAPYRPQRFARTITTYLFGLTRAIPDLGATTNFQEVAQRLLESRLTPTGLIQNELLWITLWTIQQLDLVRTQTLGRLVHEVAPQKRSQDLTIQERKSVAFRLEEWATQLQNAGAESSLQPEVRHLLVRFAPVAVGIAQNAQQFWTRVQRLESARMQGQEIEGFGNIREWVATLADREEFEEFHGHVLTGFNQLFSITGDRLPSPQAYRQARDRLIRTLRRDAYELFERRLFQLIFREDAESIEPEQFLVYGWMLLKIDQLSNQLQEYDERSDRQFLAEYPGRADVRIAHRIRTAQRLADLSDALKWEDVFELALSVLQARQAGVTQNQLALLGNWEPDTHARISDLYNTENGKGIDSSNPIRGLGNITSYHIAAAFQIGYYLTVINAVSDLLLGPIGANGQRQGGEEGDFSTFREPIMRRISPILSQFERPRRFIFHPGQFEQAARPASTPSPGTVEPPTPAIVEETVPAAGSQTTEAEPSTVPERLSIYDLALNHPKTLSLLAREGTTLGFNATQRFILRPLEDPRAQQELFFWIVPPLEPLVRQLQRIPDLNALVESQQIRDAEAGNTSEVSGLTQTQLAQTPPWFQWLIHFAELDADTLEMDIGDILAAEQRRTFGSMIELVRRATMQDRKILVKFRIRPLLERYDRHDVATYSEPDEAIDLIYRFAGNVSPRTDQEGHLAAMVLELLREPIGGDRDLATKFREIERYDLIIQYKTLFLTVKDIVENRRNKITAVLPPSEQQDTAWIDTAMVRLQGVIEAMQRQQIRSQLRFGFVGLRDPSGQHKLRSVSSSGEIVAGQPFTIDGITYNLLEVYENFQFHPDYGSPGSPAYSESQLFIPSVTGENNIPVAQRQGRSLLRIQINSRIVTVRDTNDGDLEQISHAVGMQVIVQQLNDLAAFIESAVELMLDLAEFIPGVGQVVMATRLAATIVSFILSNEFDEIKEELFVSPQELFTQLTSLFNPETFTPDRIVDLLLFQDTTFLTRLTSVRRQRPAQSHSPRRRSAIAKFARLIQRTTSIGSGVARSFGRLQSKVRFAFQGIEVFVLAHPPLVRMLQIADNYYETLANLPAEIREGVATVDELQTAYENLPSRIGDLFTTINEIEIPREIIPLDQLLEIVIDVVLERLSAKYELAGRAILFILEQLGLKQDLLDAIAAQIEDVADPNQLWVDIVDEYIEPRFDEFRTEFIQSFNDIFTTFGLSPLQGIPETNIQPEGEDFPESEGYFAERSPDEWDTYSIPTSTSGIPLNSVVRQEAEARFGHDFSHVRLHRGEDASQVTSAFGAEGLSTGSHIYLSPEISLASGYGTHILNHELAHILQRTGPRPLGGQYSDRPQVGKPGGGLQYDPSSEANAEEIARQVEHGHAPQPVEVSPTGIDELQPYINPISPRTLRRILRKLVRGEALATQYQSIAEIQEGAPMDSRLSGNQALAAEVSRVGRAFWDMIERDANFEFERPFNRGREAIANYFKNRFSATRFQTIVNALAAQSLEEVRPTGEFLRRHRRSSPGHQSPPVWDLNFRRFMQSLEGFLFGAVGFGMEMEFRGYRRQVTHSNGRDVTRFHIDSNNPIQRLKLTFLHLPVIGGTSPLWSTVIQNTFQIAPGSEEQRRYQPRLLTELRSRGPVPRIWERNEFKFAANIIEAVQWRVQGRVHSPFPPDQLPTKDRYLTTDSSIGPEPGFGHFGLRLGRYRDSVSESGTQYGFERESHHTTQFLLLEYFRNWKPSHKPFQFRNLDLYRDSTGQGLQLAGGSPSGFRYGDQTINIRGLVGDNQADRGPAMPTILVARVTHRRGNLHLQGEPDEGEGRRPSQAGTVHNRFRQGFTDTQVKTAMFASSDRQLQQLVATAQGRETVYRQIFNAMQSTYRSVRQDMMANLEEGLKTVEFHYYDDIANRRTSGQDAAHTITPNEMASVKPQAERHNDQIMGDEFGWTAQ